MSNNSIAFRYREIEIRVRDRGGFDFKLGEKEHFESSLMTAKRCIDAHYRNDTGEVARSFGHGVVGFLIGAFATTWILAVCGIIE